jgi:hypothetical protein
MTMRKTSVSLPDALMLPLKPSSPSWAFKGWHRAP